ncbi:MAG: citrate transporter [Gammaproteobacteria bacterium]|nr:MAG: citrate transporter [Gammaproteobacteria bacterium]
MSVSGVPIEFLLFAATLLGIALLHRHTLAVAMTGLGVIVAWKLAMTGFAEGPGLAGLGLHFAHEWVTLVNLLCLLVGFGFLARHFEESHLPLLLPRYLPDGPAGAGLLLGLVFILSGFLDNIAAAMIGGAMAHTLFRARVHVGYLAAIVAAANAGGAGSVIGDTTTTMMWISGVAPIEVLHAYIAAVVAFFVCAIPASLQQHRHAPIMKDPPKRVRIDVARLVIVGCVLAGAISVNIVVNSYFPEHAGDFPFIGVTVVATLVLSVPWRRPDRAVLVPGLRSSLFLLSLVACASLMPVERLPEPSWQTALGLGFVSAVFDNIPLTALALQQGGYDWGVLAYAVGFGGSMIWFGSSAGVALSSLYAEARSVGSWLRSGWHVPLAYVAGFLALMAVLGWHPQPA